jgi:hypothetical protein
VALFGTTMQSYGYEQNQLKRANWCVVLRVMIMISMQLEVMIMIMDLFKTEEWASPSSFDESRPEKSS